MTHESFWFICSVVLILVEEGSLSNETTSKYVCSGDSIKLIQNINIDVIGSVVQLYINGTENQPVASWTLQNATIADRYSRKVVLDKYGDVWIFKVFPTDEGKYSLKYKIGSSVLNFEIYLNVFVAPTSDCKPKIKRLDDTLQASLEPNDCGIPASSAIWLYYPHIHYEGKVSAVLPPKNKAGTYYACIEGPALSCVRTSMLSEYCSAFTVQDISNEAVIESSPSKNLFAMLVAILVMLSVGLVVLIINTYMNFKQCWCQKEVQNEYRLLTTVSVR